MLLANLSVAQIISKAFPTLAMLRQVGPAASRAVEPPLPGQGRDALLIPSQTRTSFQRGARVPVSLVSTPS